jgi:hypothetical protein
LRTTHHSPLTKGEDPRFRPGPRRRRPGAAHAARSHHRHARLHGPRGGHRGPIAVVAYSKDSERLASGGDDGKTVLAGAGKGRFSPDRRFLLSRLDPTRVQLWDLETARLKATFIHLYGKPDQHLAVSAEGHYRISSQAWRHVVYVVGTEAGQETLTPEQFEKEYARKNDPEKVRPLGR